MKPWFTISAAFLALAGCADVPQPQATPPRTSAIDQLNAALAADFTLALTPEGLPQLVRN